MSGTETELRVCKVRYGKSPVALFDELGLFDYGGVIYHGVWVDEEDMDILYRRNVMVVSNPGSNCKLASGIAPLTAYLEKGIPVALGTDGPSSNNALDMFREMYLVSVLSKLREDDPASIDAAKVLEMATVGGAKAIGLMDADVLATGKYADIILINMHKPNMQPENNIIKNIVYSGSKDNVRMTMIGGKFVYFDGKYNIGEKPEVIYENCRKISERILG
jgi:5-methylthioadenosine/S-adenosylhomocysteine deaminase